MNKLIKILLAIVGGCSVIMEIITPIAVALFWGLLFGLNIFSSKIILVVGGLATLFRAIKIGWIKLE
jgi:hypothetical protein